MQPQRKLVFCPSEQVYDYAAVVDQVARVLRPGGLFLACEWGHTAAMAGDLDPQVHAPRTCAFYQAVNDTLESRGIPPIAQYVADYIGDSGHFERIRPRVHEMPVGDWHRNPQLRQLGANFRGVLEMYAASMSIVMLESGRYHCMEVESLVEGFMQEMHTVPGLVCEYYTVRARKIRG